MAGMDVVCILVSDEGHLCRLGWQLTYETHGVVHCPYHFCCKDALFGGSCSRRGPSPAPCYFEEEFLAGYPVSPERGAGGVAAEAELEGGGTCGGGIEARVDVVLGGAGEDRGGMRHRAGVLDRRVRLLREAVQGRGGGVHRGGSRI